MAYLSDSIVLAAAITADVPCTSVVAIANIFKVTSMAVRAIHVRDGEGGPETVPFRATCWHCLLALHCDWC